MADKTIEPKGGKFAVYEHDEYPRWSVLAGQPRRSFKGRFDTVEEAQAVHPDARVVEGSTRVDYQPLPSEPPDWFDPAEAGERW